MKMTTKSSVAAVAAAAALFVGTVAAAPSQAAPSQATPSQASRSAAAPSAATAKALGQKSLAAVLTSGKVGFDHNARDFDILTAAVLAVLKAKPTSAVSVLTDGSVPLTAFLPTDSAFRRLVGSVTGKYYRSEKRVFAAVAGLGIDTVEAVLLYHVVPGATITARKALKANGVVLTTAQGGTIGVRVTRGPRIELKDKDLNSRNPRVLLYLTNINYGNRQIAHGINRVLRPIDLPRAS